MTAYVTPFIVGATLASAWFAYAAVHLYRNMSRKLDESKRDRAVRAVRKMAWWRLPGLAGLGGVVGILLWNGISAFV